MTNLIRAFIAIDLPEPLQQTIRLTQAGLKSAGLKMNWIKPEAIHLTLKFLGDIYEDEIRLIQQVMDDCVSRVPPVTCLLKGVGVFPGIRKPRVFWVGLDGQTSELARMSIFLNEQIQRVTTNRILAETRPFKAHLTIGRIRSELDSPRLIAGLKQFGMLTSEPFTTTEIHLYQSRLHPSGAVYTRLGTSRMMIDELLP